jgi:hypothetical protein
VVCTFLDSTPRAIRCIPAPTRAPFPHYARSGRWEGVAPI